jgi:hypothetical protein
MWRIFSTKAQCEAPQLNKVKCLIEACQPPYCITLVSGCPSSQITNKMKVSGCIIQKRQIIDHTENLFNANYKGKRIYISTDHGFGKPQYDHLKRFLIDVVDIKTGMYDVQTYQDLHTVRDAIIYALKGAMLVS